MYIYIIMYRHSLIVLMSWGVGFQSCGGEYFLVAPLGSIVAKVYLCGRARWSTGEVSQ